MSAVKSQGLLSAVVIGASLVLAAVAFALVGGLLRNAGDTGPEAMLARVNRDLDAQAARIAAVEQAVEGAAPRHRRAERAPRDAAPPPRPPPRSRCRAPLPPDQFGGAAPLPESEDLVEGMQLAKGRFNQGIERPDARAVLRELIGEPRDELLATPASR